MLDRSFASVYTKFKLHFYKEIFKRFEAREASLTAVETFCVEVIYALDRPTIHEFAEFTQISAPNATYKVNSLIKKGYITKERSPLDKREYHLVVTDRFLDYYNISYSYIQLVMGRIRERLEPDDLDKFEEILDIMSDELMPEIALSKKVDEG